MSNDTEFIRKSQLVIDALKAAKKEVVRENEYDPPILEELLKEELNDPGQQILGDLQNRILDSLSDLEGLITLQVSSGTLEDAKKWKAAAIDRRTDELIARGFEFPPSSGVYFSASLEAQSRLHTLLLLSASLTFPIRWNTQDDLGYFDITSLQVLQQFFGTGVITVKGIVDAGTTLKDSVRAATTISDVLAVTDSR